MSVLQSQYPDFNVMDEKGHWDDHTRQIVEERLKVDGFESLNNDEAATLFQLCSVLLHDERNEILNFVIKHFDKLLSSNIGESQRKKGVPAERELIRKGIGAIDEYCISNYGYPFKYVNSQIQHTILDKLMRGDLQLQTDGVKIPPQALFSKILTEAVSAYYSHPIVWSEIGYAGPAYPRGYVRSEFGLTDPWEAKRIDAQ